MSPAATIGAAAASAAVLDAADELFYHRGVAAVTMADVRDRSGVSMRRLYGLYPSKSDLVAGWLRHRHTTWMAGFAGAVDTALAAGRAPVDAIFDALRAWMVATEFRGCGFINTHAEYRDLTDEHRAIIRDHKLALAAHLDTVVPGGAGLAVLVDGAIVQAAIHHDAAPIEQARLLARSSVSADTPDPTPTPKPRPARTET